MIKKSEAAASFSEELRAELEQLEKDIDHEISVQYRHDLPTWGIGVDVSKNTETARRIMEVTYEKAGWQTKIETHRDGTFLYIS